MTTIFLFCGTYDAYGYRRDFTPFFPPYLVPLSVVPSPFFPAARSLDDKKDLYVLSLFLSPVLFGRCERMRKRWPATFFLKTVGNPDRKRSPWSSFFQGSSPLAAGFCFFVFFLVLVFFFPVRG